MSKAKKEGIRERRQHENKEEELASSDHDARTNGGDDIEKPAKTFGRTPDGTTFIVPETHDMVSQLLDPRQPKNLSDFIVLSVLAMHVLAFYALPAKLKQPIFAAIFLFWRASYNVFIGYLLHIQSNHRRLVAWAKKYQVFEKPPHNPRPWLYNMLKRELETKIPNDYAFAQAPVEYNTWLVFRRLVDLILMCDFASYVLLAIAYTGHPSHESSIMSIARWVVGIALVAFNVWVKLDAHRVVKDYAWYWGDFYYTMINSELTFDGVFEIFPHPMYSIGYIGYYGISIMAASYSVMFISLLAHIAQFIFLMVVENPHIEKTYNPPVPKRRRMSSNSAGKVHSDLEDEHDQGHPPAVHNLMGFKNIDLFRITDVSVIILQAHVLLLTIFTPSTPMFQTLFILYAIICRLWYSIGLGILLRGQSDRKSWTRHFIKFGEEIDEAWRQWKGMYHLSMLMCYATFIAATWKMYEAPTEWVHGFALFRHIFGASLVALQVWTAVSIYDSLSEFGWYYGNFFYDAGKLTYSGIYRYLNNPERIIGLAGIWGAVFITGSKAIFGLALFSHVLSLGFLEYVEKPHMQKLYGRTLRQEAGVTKNIKRTLPKQLQDSVDKMWQEMGRLVEDLLRSGRPRFAAGGSKVVGDGFKPSSSLAPKIQDPTRVAIPHSAPNLAEFDTSAYSVTINGPSSKIGLSDDECKDSIVDSKGNRYRSLVFDYGSPVEITWRAPSKHGNDWIGLYRVADNSSREVTRTSAAGRWIATVPNEHESSADYDGILSFNFPVATEVDSTGSQLDQVSGQMIFRASKLCWETGIFEFRYHHNGKHTVMANSPTFEIRINKCEPDDIPDVEAALLPVVQNCFDRDPMTAPNTISESFGVTGTERDSRYAKRVVYAVYQMFGIEFAPEVVLADGCVKNLAWRIYNAKKVLAPNSMSRSKETTLSKEDET